jgi:hypothetical protein
MIHDIADNRGEIRYNRRLYGELYHHVSLDGEEEHPSGCVKVSSLNKEEYPSG